MVEVIFKLNEEVSVSNHGHILYLYESQEKYLDNVCTYIQTAIELKQSVLIIDTEENWGMIKPQLASRGIDYARNPVFFTNAHTFYYHNGTFNCDAIVAHFQQDITHLQTYGHHIRTWANVRWFPEETLSQELVHFEQRADNSVKDMSLLSVCAYDAEVLPAAYALKLKRSHGYVMTDIELFKSPLYAKQNPPIVFPSLSEQHRLKTEMDLYKQKLDFAHVVSHEVRNPLTVIKAYCSILLQQPDALNQNISKRLGEINEYVDIIDQELTHIIHTEQMLSNDQLWKKDWIHPSALIHEVVRFMAIKAKSQSQQLVAKVDIPEELRMYTSKVGLKLILSNLISNAIKYNEEQCHVTFTAKVEGDTLVFQISDQGMGMSTEQLAHLFKKYSKLNHEKGGQGIGLYMVKQLLDASGGTIHFESTLGVGTDVHVRMAVNEKVQAHSSCYE